jgi:hypothetical protein
LGIARDISKLFSADTSIVTSTELTSALQNVTVDLSGYVTASAVSASIANIDVTESLNSRIFISSASPSTPQNGQIWIDTTTASAPIITVRGSSAWRRPSLGRFSASGGATTAYGLYTYHTFTSTGQFIANGTKDIEVLLVAGGGGGGYYWGAGGGAGGVQFLSIPNLSSAAYSVTVGAGGANYPGGNGGYGTNGGNSIFDVYTAAVGGGGGAGGNPASGPGNNGGSGGGGGGNGATRSGGSGISGQGFSGGSGGSGVSGGGAGGGAAGNGANGGTSPVNGGAGTSSYSTWGLATSTGELVSGTYFYGGGGAGYPGGSGGNGGGADYATNNAVANTGGGGGADAIAGGAGSGIVIIRYLT